jgi:hypothetical protein
MNTDDNNFNKLDTRCKSWQIFYHDNGVLKKNASDEGRNM